MTKDSISNHLLELRSRLLKVVMFFVVLTIIGIPFASEIYDFVAAPMISLLPDGSSMIATQVTSPFMAPIKLVLYVALLFSMPWLFYQAWMYISPGLYKKEKKFAGPLMFSTVVLFFSGVSFAFFVVCPIIFKFFIGMAPESILVMTDISQYLSFIFKLVFAFGIAFEIPIATVLLINSGITTKKSLVKARPYLIVLFLIRLPSVYVRNLLVILIGLIISSVIFFGIPFNIFSDIFGRFPT